MTMKKDLKAYSMTALALGLAAIGTSCGSSEPAEIIAASCEQLRSGDPMLKDGDYTLYVGSDRASPWKAYCVMSVMPALTYLPLSTENNRNFSQYTAGGSAPGTDVRTSYSRVLIDPTTFTINTGDQRFATSTGSLMQAMTQVSSMPYAVALGCARAPANGVANVDLSGTKFALTPDSLEIGGYMPLGTATPIPDGKAQVFELLGGGSCGWYGPKGANQPFNMASALLRLVYVP